jgi:uncharacterized protein YkwD
MSRRRLAVALAIAISLASSPSTAAAAEDPQAMVEVINKARAKHGLRSLRHHPSLSRSARRYAAFLLRTGRFGHADHIRASKRFKRLGEVLSWHRGPRPRRERTVRRWTRSAWHRPVILNSRFGFVGAGRVRGEFRGRRCTIWVVHFGAPRRQNRVARLGRSPLPPAA